ncbi:MAG: hypothetical protein K9M10_03855 [Candidatus Pacebacteria bacterium]|nr:hypothetical protein [Candidatus Paceibacterota bacterium]MCF7857585.1 hypothetical protein [Candidatus Paceibacterota bacterium]
MTNQLEVTDVVYDGSFFEASSSEGKLTGNGAFTQNEAATGGTIHGTLREGPEERLWAAVTIEFSGGSGTCTFD